MKGEFKYLVSRDWVKRVRKKVAIIVDSVTGLKHI